MMNIKFQEPFIIPEDIQIKWQNIINIIAKLLNIPAGLIMRKVDSDITVFLSSETENNPYTPGDKEHFEDSGLYCETVIKTNKMLLVPNALADDHWKNNPDVKLNMISYLGFPITLPDKTPFGTLCVLDNKENGYSDLHKELLAIYRDTIERDILLLYNNHYLKDTNLKMNILLAEKETFLKEIHHRIKNNIASIEGLLSMQASSTDNIEVKTALQESISRIQSTRVLYDKLLLSKDYQDVSMKNYIDSLIDSLFAVFPESKNVSIERIITDFTVSSEKAITIGIIINELMTNVFKYAFKGNDGGNVKFELIKSENTITLTIKDDGIGIDKTVEAKNISGFGLSMVTMLAEHLKGTYTIENDNGFKSVLKFEI